MIESDGLSETDNGMKEPLCRDIIYNKSVLMFTVIFGVMCEQITVVFTIYAYIRSVRINMHGPE